MKINSRLQIIEIDYLISFLIEVPFWFALLMWSILPSTKNSWFEIESTPINLKDIINTVVNFFLSVDTKKWLTNFHIEKLINQLVSIYEMCQDSELSETEKLYSNSYSQS